MSTTENVHITITPIDPIINTEEWSNENPLWFRIAAWSNRVLPRGKGAIPRWIGRKFGKEWKTIIETDSGCKLAVDPQNLDLFVTIQGDGAWEPWVRKACILAMREGDVMFDVGANAGTISNEVAKACPNIRIKAFEPQVDMARLVAVSASLNNVDCIEVFPLAVGDHCGTIQLHKPAHSLHASVAASGESREQVVDCPLICLDDVVLTGRLPRPDFIKIDVEGGELNVLKGAQKLISQYLPVIIFETNDNCLRFDYTRDDLFRLISGCGDYQFFKVAPGDTLAVPIGRSIEFEGTYPEIPWGKES
jgi:FkbM family methyltransferase